MPQGPCASSCSQGCACSYTGTQAHRVSWAGWDGRSPSLLLPRGRWHQLAARSWEEGRHSLRVLWTQKVGAEPLAGPSVSLPWSQGQATLTAWIVGQSLAEDCGG